MATQLNTHFARIVRDYFPRWTAGRRWRVTNTSRRTVQGYCDRERRVIELCEPDSDTDAFDRLLIHEICHAITSGFHGQPWQRRMTIAASRAEQLNRPVLADLLRQDTQGYIDGGSDGLGTRRDVYQKIEGYVRDSGGKITFNQIRDMLCDYLGWLRREFNPAYPRARKVYDAAMNDVAARVKLLAEMRRS
jgi:SprT-like family protein